MSEVKKPKTPLLDQLESGPWPSFVKEMKKSADNPAVQQLLEQLERSYEERIGHWKHGGLVGVMGYGGGVIGRYSDLAAEFPAIAEFHTFRVNQPAGWFYTSEALRKLCDIWERHGSGLTNMHGSTGDVIFLGAKTAEIEPVFKELTDNGFDLGGSGSDVRTPSCCVGPARCEWACYDTLQTCYDFTQHYQDELHRPAFPYKYKFKFSGCANDCVASIARSDMSFIGTWRDDIQVDAAEVQKVAAAGKIDIQKDVCDLCPARCMRWDGKTLKITNAECMKCMHCINAMPKALAPGKDRGCTVLLGAKAPIVGGALLSSVLIPFIKMEPPYEDIKELVSRIWDLWADNGKNRERVGEFIQRIGLSSFLEQIGLDPTPEMVVAPRSNPYIFFQDEVEETEGAEA
jgi:sulfite reductase alpha subunit